MKNFQEFINEGGNVSIGDESADRIDLVKHDRETLVNKLTVSLDSLNNYFKKETGLWLWDKDLFQSKRFLSGSAFHFFDVDNISHPEFIKNKPSLGDIDTQVDGELDSIIGSFLAKITGKVFGSLKFIGVKKSAGQYISLWNFESQFNIQIDLELVEFEDGKPTAWSQFSHSSDWNDMKQGIKGVAHKYLLRAMEAPHLKDVIIQPKTSRGKEKEVLSSTRAFSVSNGLRTKLAPVLDSDGVHAMKSGKPVYTELDTTKSKGNTDLNWIFSQWFGHEASQTEIKMMGSFIGLIDLIKKNVEKSKWKAVLTGFAHTLWGPGAQGLYRGDANRDLEEKYNMMKVIALHLGGSMDDYQAQIKTYYENYKG